jgi:hypothetical protein
MDRLIGQELETFTALEIPARSDKPAPAVIPLLRPVSRSVAVIISLIAGLLFGLSGGVVGAEYLAGSRFTVATTPAAFAAPVGTPDPAADKRLGQMENKLDGLSAEVESLKVNMLIICETLKAPCNKD